MAIVPAITRLVMVIIDLCRKLKLTDTDVTETAILEIIENAINGIFGGKK